MCFPFRGEKVGGRKRGACNNKQKSLIYLSVFFSSFALCFSFAFSSSQEMRRHTSPFFLCSRKKNGTPSTSRALSGARTAGRPPRAGRARVLGAPWSDSRADEAAGEENEATTPIDHFFFFFSLSLSKLQSKRTKERKKTHPPSSFPLSLSLPLSKIKQNIKKALRAQHHPGRPRARLAGPFEIRSLVSVPREGCFLQIRRPGLLGRRRR